MVAFLLTETASPLNEISVFWSLTSSGGKKRSCQTAILLVNNKADFNRQDVFSVCLTLPSNKKSSRLSSNLLKPTCRRHT